MPWDTAGKNLNDKNTLDLINFNKIMHFMNNKAAVPKKLKN